jgi:hypothetical protein
VLALQSHMGEACGTRSHEAFATLSYRPGCVKRR